MRTLFRHLVLVLMIVLLSLPTAIKAQYGIKTMDWPVYGGDGGSTRYSPLDQITRDNVSNLQVAWTFKTDNFAPNVVPQNQASPIMVKGVLYFTAGPRRYVVAVDAGTGELIWTFRPEEGARGERAPRRTSRGVAYWTDGKDERIILVTPGFQLIALNAKTGQPIPSFGTAGTIDLFKELDLDFKGDLTGLIGNSSPVVVSKDTIVIGPALQVGSRVNKENVKADIMAFDVRTGKKKWTFHTIPRKGEPGYETWETGAEFTGNVGLWPPFTVDEDLGYVYLPLEAPTNDSYGGHRHGDNLYSDSLVCLDVRTGKKVWHYQLIHHDIWDWDIPSPPILVDITVGGKTIKSVVQPTKQAFAYVFDRQTGQPVWPIEERPVFESDVPGEKTARTQPFPTKPPPFDRQGFSLDDVADFTPEIKAAVLEAIKPYKLGPLFTPPSVANGPDGRRGTLQLPNFQGGSNWEGGAATETGFVYIGSKTDPSVGGLVTPQNNQFTSAYVLAQGGAPRGPGGLSIVKPPYGRITAYDMNKGEIAWQMANGDTPPNVRNNPALNGVTLPRTGSASRAGLLVTKTLLFAGEGWGGQPFFRAHDKRTGEILWETRIPAGVQSGLPITYMHNGRQFIVFAAGDPTPGAAGASQMIAYALGQGGGQRGGGQRGVAPAGARGQQ